MLATYTTPYPPLSIPSTKRLFLSLLGAHPRVRVGHLDSQNPRLLNDGDPLSCGDTVSNLSGEGRVVHEEKLDFTLVVDQESLESVGHDVASLLV